MRTTPTLLSGSHPPSPDTLAHQFGPWGLARKGREDGRHGEPSIRQKGLNGVEIQVKGFCEKLLEEKREDFTKSIKIQEERIDSRLLLTAPEVESSRLDLDHKDGDEGVRDIETSKACRDLEHLVDTDKNELEGAQRVAQEAIDDYNNLALPLFWWAV